MKRLKPMLYLPIVIIILFFAGWFYCYHYWQFWTHLETGRFAALTEVKSKYIRGHRGHQILVHKNFLPVIQIMENLAAQNDLKLLITSSYRIPGRKLSKKIVKPAVLSNHHAGHAVDLNVDYHWKRYESKDLKNSSHEALPETVLRFINALRSIETVRWGGDFTREDPVHFDIAINTTDPLLWQTYADECLKDFSNARPKWRR